MCRGEEYFIQHLITSDEAHFDLSGYVNKQNSRFWGRENPQIVHERPLHSKRVTVWCALTYSCVIGPYFFEDENGAAVTVTAERYNHMLNTFFLPELQRLNLTDMWMQQDGATSHTARLSMTTLRANFPGHLISRFGDIHWPSRSPDLTPVDFFLWGYLKDRVYAGRPHTTEELKQSIHREITAIPVDLLNRTLRDMRNRALECFSRDGEHLRDVIFRS